MRMVALGHYDAFKNNYYVTGAPYWLRDVNHAKAESLPTQKNSRHTVKVNTSHQHVGDAMDGIRAGQRVINGEYDR